MDKNLIFINQPSNKGLLAGLLKCDQCGCNMIITKKRYKQKEYRYYICQTHNKFGDDKCTQINIPADQLEEKVLNDLRGSIQRSLERPTDSDKDRESHTRTLENQLQDVETKIEAIQMDTLRLVRSRDILSDDQFIITNEKLKTELDELLTKKNQIELQLRPIQNKEKIREAMQRLIVMSINELLIKKEQIIDVLIKEIKVNGHEISIHYNFK